MAILLKTVPDKVYKFLLDKQLEFKKEKNRCVGLEETIYKLLVNAYLIQKKKETEI